MKILISIILSIFLCLSTKAQEFNKGMFTSISPDLVFLNNFTPIALENNNKELLFDKQNPYTFILFINDAQEQVYQLLYQTNFSGELTFIALSNNLYPYFDCKKTRWLSFWNCNKIANTPMLASQITEQHLNCILERLNSCYEKK